MTQIDHSFLQTGFKWSSSDIQNLGFNFSTSTPLYLYAQLAFLNQFDNLGGSSQFSFSSNSSVRDQQDIVQFLLIDRTDLDNLSGNQTVNSTLVNTANTPVGGSIVNYRVSFSDVISADISESVSGEIQLVNHEGESSSSESLGFLPGTTSASGDVVINYLDPGYNQLAPGEKGYWLLLHELGHAIGGLEDVQSTSQENTYLDNQKYTAMSYNSYGDVYTSGLGLLDIAALQDTYGTVNTATRSGNTVYALGQGLGFYGTSANNAFLYTIWDGGGEDTIDASDFNVGAEIDLREGHFSSIGKKANGSGWNFDVSATSNDPDPGNVAIAYGTVIENAIGTEYADRLIGNEANNELQGGDGNDTYVYKYGGGFDTIIDTDGDDTLILKPGIHWSNMSSYSDGMGSLVLDIYSPGSALVGQITILDYFADSDNVVETIYFTEDDGLGGYELRGQNMTGTNGAETITGTDYDDYIRARNGDDTLNGGDGADRLRGDDGNDTLWGGEGSDRLEGGNGADVLYGESEWDNLFGDSGNDTLWGGSGYDALHGGADNDALHGESGDDELYGGTGDDTYYYSLGDGSDYIYDDGGSNDRLIFDNTIDIDNVLSMQGEAALVLAIYDSPGHEQLIDTITIMGHYSESSNFIEEIIFQTV